MEAEGAENQLLSVAQLAVKLLLSVGSSTHLVSMLAAGGDAAAVDMVVDCLVQCTEACHEAIWQCAPFGSSFTVLAPPQRKTEIKSHNVGIPFSIIFSCLSLVFCLEDHCPAWPEVVDVTCGSDDEDLVEVNKGPNHQGLDDQEKRFQLVLLRNWLVLAAAVVGAVVASVTFMATARPPPEPVFRPRSVCGWPYWITKGRRSTAGLERGGCRFTGPASGSQPRRQGSRSPFGKLVCPRVGKNSFCHRGFEITTVASQRTQKTFGCSALYSPLQSVRQGIVLGAARSSW